MQSNNKNGNKSKKNECFNNNSNKRSTGRRPTGFFVCFRPVVMEDTRQEGGNSNNNNRDDDTLFKYLNVENKDGVVLQQLVPALSPSVSHKDTIVCSHHKNKGYKNLKKILNAVLFGTSLAKNNKKRKLQQKLKESNGIRNSSARFANPTKSDKSGITQSIHNDPANKNCQAETKTNVPNPSCCCSCSSSSNLVESRAPKREATREIKRGNYNSNIGLYFVVVSLAVLVIWGKTCAIVCASTWLFFVPHWSRSINSFRRGVDVDETESEEYKKKIIMGGFLERNRNRGT